MIFVSYNNLNTAISMVLNSKIQKVGCYLITMIALTFCFSELSAQSIESLEKDINLYRKQIEKAEKMLESKTSEEKSNTQQLSIIRSQINNRTNIVNNLKKQASIVTSKIKTNEKNIKSLTSERDALRKEYADMMVITYKNYLFNNTLLFLFASKDFNDLQTRMYYLRRYSEQRYALSQELDVKSKELAKQVDSLAIKKSEFDKLSSDTQKEINSLSANSKKYNTILSSIKKDKSKLAQEISTDRKNILKLQNQIKEIVAEEARKEKARIDALSKEKQLKYIEQSTEFEKFKGKLPYPTSEGVITDRFGKQAHPLDSKLIVDNKGINFQVPDGSDIKAVFNGVVAKIFFFQGLNNSVMIRHGDYYTTYSGLTDVAVSVGDKVMVGQTIGSIKGAALSLHFELWKGTTNLNPELWLSK